MLNLMIVKISDEHKSRHSLVALCLSALVYLVYTGSLAILVRLCINDSFSKGQE